MEYMENDKFLGNDGLATQFFVNFWDDIKDLDFFIASNREAKERNELSIFQRQVIIKIIETHVGNIF